MAIITDNIKATWKNTKDHFLIILVSIPKLPED